MTLHELYLFTSRNSRQKFCFAMPLTFLFMDVHKFVKMIKMVLSLLQKQTSKLFHLLL